MVNTNLSLAFRRLRTNVLYSVLVIFGLAAGIATCIATLQWSSWHLTFDRSYPEFRSIYRLTLEEEKDGFYRHMARVIHGDIIRSIAFSDAFAEIDKIGRLSPFRKAIVKIEENEFYENFAYSCDASWVEIFSPKVIKGSALNLLKEPKTAVLTEHAAKKYFGTADPIGKSFKIIHQFNIEPEEFTVTGLIEDFPDNSHLKAEVLTSLENPVQYEGTAWTYLKLKPGAFPDQLEKNLKLFIDSNFEEDYTSRMQPRLQPLHEIHLYSHKPREIVPNVQFKSVIILLLTGMFVFMLSWFNFMLLSVSQHQLNIHKLVIQWQMGAGRKELFRQFLIDFLLIGGISLLLGLFLVLLLRNEIIGLTGEYIFGDMKLNILIFVALLVLLTGSALITSWYTTFRLYRYLRYKYLSAKSSAPPDAAIRNYFIRAVIITEFIITFILSSNLFLIKKQTDYIISEQMGSKDPSTIQIPNLHRYVIDRFPAFREAILKSPHFPEVTGTMEQPTGLAMDAVQFQITGMPETGQRLYLFPVEENFIRFYDIPVICGDDLPVNYHPGDSTEYFLLNETAALMIAGSNFENLVGREIDLDFAYPDLIGDGRIMGIVKDFYLSGLDYEVIPMIIFPKYTWLYCFSLRINGNHDEALAYLESVWNDLFPDFPLNYQYTQDIIDDYYRSEISEIKIRSVFSILSFIIAGTGLFALSGIFLNRKLKYAAIRKINGASLFHILIPELLYYFYMALIAGAIAVIPSFFLMEHWLRNFVYKLKIPVSLFLLTTLVLVLFSWISVIYHSWKLAKSNPVDILRQ
ncbi:MAG: ABC transporter permease [Bacteroidales bacterium]|nr:ABC transporter permease [Bacteroidales bacterium]